MSLGEGHRYLSIDVDEEPSEVKRTLTEGQVLVYLTSLLR
jgi:hypothetical protein